MKFMRICSYFSNVYLLLKLVKERDAFDLNNPFLGLASHKLIAHIVYGFENYMEWDKLFVTFAIFPPRLYWNMI